MYERIQFVQRSTNPVRLKSGTAPSSLLHTLNLNTLTCLHLRQLFKDHNASLRARKGLDQSLLSLAPCRRLHHYSGTLHYSGT